MKKILVFLVVALLALISVVNVSAGGDKVRGDSGQGTVVQQMRSSPTQMP